MICNSCGAELKPRTKKCGYCGIKHNCIFVTREEFHEIQRDAKFCYYPIINNNNIYAFEGLVGTIKSTEGRYVVLK